MRLESLRTLHSMFGDMGSMPSGQSPPLLERASPNESECVEIRPMVPPNPSLNADVPHAWAAPDAAGRRLACFVRRLPTCQR